MLRLQTYTQAPHQERLAQVETRERAIELASDNVKSSTSSKASAKLGQAASGAPNKKPTSKIKRNLNKDKAQASQNYKKRLRSATLAAKHDDDLVEMAPPAKKPIACVDLTDD
jgi:hypothetical protein